MIRSGITTRSQPRGDTNGFSQRRNIPGTPTLYPGSPSDTLANSCIYTDEALHVPEFGTYTSLPVHGRGKAQVAPPAEVITASWWVILTPCGSHPRIADLVGLHEGCCWALRSASSVSNAF